jgi:glyoxylase-like metal-dependent hydrolase (beta-lactamase superfamily II)
LYVHHGAINVGILRDGLRALLIDYGDGDVQETLAELGIQQVEIVLLTHHHRDQASGLAPLVDAGTRVCVPAEERSWFEEVEEYWANPENRWHLYSFRPHNLMLARSLPVHTTCKGGDLLYWGGARITVLDTPGHTEGSLSYRVEVDSTSFLFCGDLIYGPGQVWELYSLQKGWVTEDYHGFLGDRGRLMASARAASATDSVALIPSHGKLIDDPVGAVELLCERLASVYEHYAAASALRHYFPGLFREFRVRDRLGERRRRETELRWPDHFMPLSEALPVPDYLRHVGTTWLVLSEDRAAFAVDCGTEDVVQQVQAFQGAGELTEVEWLWISHYHDDHVDAIPQFCAAFGASVLADEHVARVVERPLAWRLPCISPVVVPVDRVTAHGESWTWHEYTITAYHLPGQTEYHGGLLVEGRGQRIFFCGDSFTMAGMDDYCAGNRNLLGLGVGFDACLTLLEGLRPDLILNCHVEQGFTFDGEQLAFMRANLTERVRLYQALLPWDHPNYGLDESWVRCDPYEQRVEPGEVTGLEIAILNHSTEARKVACRPVLPKEWGLRLDPQEGCAAAKEELRVPFTWTVPEDAMPGQYVVPVEIAYHGRFLGQFREAIVVVA